MSISPVFKLGAYGGGVKIAVAIIDFRFVFLEETGFLTIFLFILFGCIAAL